MVILKLGNLAEGVKYKAYRTHFNLKKWTGISTDCYIRTSR